MAPEFYGKFKRLKSQLPELLTPATPSGIVPAPQKKDYFFDGAIGSYQSPDLATEYIFVTARRGGNVIYAFDVSTPSAPKFMWKKTPADLSLPHQVDNPGMTDRIHLVIDCIVNEWIEGLIK